MNILKLNTIVCVKFADITASKNILSWSAIPTSLRYQKILSMKTRIPPLIHSMGSPYSIVANVLDCNIVVSEFKLQWCYYVHFWTNTSEKSMNLLISPAMG